MNSKNVLFIVIAMFVAMMPVMPMLGQATAPPAVITVVGKLTVTVAPGLPTSFTCEGESDKPTMGKIAITCRNGEEEVLSVTMPEPKAGTNGNGVVLGYSLDGHNITLILTKPVGATRVTAQIAALTFGQVNPTRQEVQF